ncbi:TPA: hypothetical protein ONA83_003594 [Pseudomonas aeruginosa]|nr:hypothetical protein [Pseudomonas aeruginosa]
MTDHAELRRLAKAAEFGGGAHEDIEFSNQLDFHAACTPAAILALLDEIDRLKAESDRLRQGMKGDFDLDAWLDWSKEKEQIKAEIEALRRFAARYRWLRDSCTRQWDVMYRDIEIVINGDGADDCEDLDGIIDAALKGATQ